MMEKCCRCGKVKEIVNYICIECENELINARDNERDYDVDGS